MRPTNRLRKSAAAPESPPRRRTLPSAPPFHMEPHFFISSGNDCRVEGAQSFSYHTDSAVGSEHGSYLENENSSDWRNYWIDLGGEG